MHQYAHIHNVVSPHTIFFLEYVVSLCLYHIYVVSMFHRPSINTDIDSISSRVLKHLVINIINDLVNTIYDLNHNFMA